MSSPHRVGAVQCDVSLLYQFSTRGLQPPPSPPSITLACICNSWCWLLVNILHTTQRQNTVQKYSKPMVSFYICYRDTDEKNRNSPDDSFWSGKSYWPLKVIVFHHVAVWQKSILYVLWCQKIFGQLLKIFGQSPTEVWCPGQAGGWWLVCSSGRGVFWMEDKEAGRRLPARGRGDLAGIVFIYAAKYSLYLMVYFSELLRPGIIKIRAAVYFL